MSDRKTPQYSAQSKEFVKVPMSAVVGGVTYNPTGDTVQLAFTSVNVDPEAADWVNGSWETYAGDFYARAMIGPGAKQLSEGRYEVWVKVTDNPEVPVIRAGQIEVY